MFLSRQSDGGRLYKNLGGFRFEDITIKTPKALQGGAYSAKLEINDEIEVLEDLQ